MNQAFDDIGVLAVIALALLLLVLAFTGCAAGRARPEVAYTHPTKTEAQFQQDSYQCAQDAQVYVQGESVFYIYRDFARRYHQCMTVKYGWSGAQFPVDGLARYGGAST